MRTTTSSVARSLPLARSPAAARPALAVAAAAAVLALAALALGGRAWAARAAAATAPAPSIGTVIPLSSIEAAFAAFTIVEAARVSAVVAVVYADHLSDGTREDLAYVDALRAQVESAKSAAVAAAAGAGAGTGSGSDSGAGASAAFGDVVWAPVRWFPGRSSRFWVRYLRWVGFGLLPRGVEYVLWLDADEVLDAPRFLEWWASPGAPPTTRAAAVKLDSYAYFRDERFQSTVVQNSPVLARRVALAAVALFFENDGKEREMFYDDLPGRGTAHAAGRDGLPLVHHYSWVRTKEGMLQKVRAWGHNADAGVDWVGKVEEEFSHPFTGRDFVHGDAFKTLPASWLDTLRARRRAPSPPPPPPPPLPPSSSS